MNTLVEPSTPARENPDEAVRKDRTIEELEKLMNDDNYVIGECDHHYHPGNITQRTFQYKGCWTCWQYSGRSGESGIYLDSQEAAQLYGISVGTIYRWIKQGRLKARLFVMGRRNGNLPRRVYRILKGQEVK